MGSMNKYQGLMMMVCLRRFRINDDKICRKRKGECCLKYIIIH